MDTSDNFAVINFPCNNCYFFTDNPKTRSIHITIIKFYMINGWELQSAFHLYFKTAHAYKCYRTLKRYSCQRVELGRQICLKAETWKWSISDHIKRTYRSNFYTQKNVKDSLESPYRLNKCSRAFTRLYWILLKKLKK